MSKRLKMICAIASFAVCIAILVFGVYSAREVEYSLFGTINYEINTLFVDVNTSLYALNSDDEKSVNSVPSSMPKLEKSLVSGSALPTNIVKLDYSNSDTTIQNGISEEETLAYSDALNLNYGDYTGSNNQAYLFYLVMEIKNYSSEPVSAILDLDNLYNQTTNTVVQPLYTKINIQGKGDSEYSTAYFITALGYDYPSFIQSSNFSDITLTVNAGELVPTDVSNFTFSQSGSNYRITAYNGTDTDIVIPSQYNGANVTAIGSSVFRNSNITSVYIPNTITSVGSSCFDGSQDLATVNIQPSSSNLTFSSYAFRNCSSLRSIYFPNNVTTLSSYAFYNCTGLSYVIFAEDSKITNIPSYAFYGCSGLRSTIIPYDATSIGASAFYACSGLQSIEIPSNVTSIGSSAFNDCTNLISVTFGENSLLESIGEFAFNECSSLHTIYIPNKTMTIGRAAFQNCENIQEVHISSVYDWLKINFDSIGSCPLYFPDNAKLYVSEELLTEVTISDFIDGDKQITEIPNCAFKNQSQLASITIPDFVTSIGDSAFSGCSSLQSIGIPSGVTSIGSFAFYGCSNIEDVHIDSVNDWLTLCGTFGISRNNYQNPLQASSDASLYVNGELLTEVAASDFVDENDNEITTLSSYAFDGQSQLASVEIPDFVTSIGDYAFSGCSSLQSIGIPSSVTSIGYYAFRNCTNLVSVTFEENSVLNSIRSCAFEDCSSLESIKIPSSVTSVGNSTFSGCSSLESIEIPSSVTSIGNEAFQNCENIQEVLIDSVYHWLTLCGTFGTSSEDFFYQNPLSVRSYAKLYVNGELLTEITAADFERDSVQITNVPEYAFWGQSQLTSVTIPDFVTSIGSFAFNGCSSLESIAIPSSVTSIQSYSFQNCTNLVSVTFEENSALQSIGGYAFSGSSLQSIEIPSGVTSIGSSAFKNCTNLVLVFNLSSLDIVAGNSSHGYVAYYADMVLNSVSVAENFITQNGNYYYRVDDGTLVYLGAVPTDENTYVVIPEGTTTIRADMIPNKNLVSISIPTSVTSIGNYTFQNCTNIQEVHIDSVYHWLTLCGTFSDSTANNDYRNPLRVSSYARLYINGELLTEITASDFESGGVSITEIPNYAFCRQSQLLSVIIPSFVTSIGGSAFSGCTNLQEVHIDSVYDWLKMYVGSWFVSSNAKLYINGELLTEVKASDFVDGEDQITVVNGYAFSGQSQLVSVEIGDSVTSIGDYAFRGCSSLQSIKIPSSVTSIGNYAFQNCTNLVSVTFEENSVLNSLGIYAFSGCSSLQSIEIPSGVTSIGSDAFYGCNSLESIIIPSSVKSIGSYAFQNCTNLVSVTFEENSALQSIGGYAFSGCSSLESIIIPSSVTSVGDCAFNGCRNIQEVHIDSVYHWLNLCSTFVSNNSANLEKNPLYVSSNARLYINSELLTEVKASDFVDGEDQITVVNRSAFSGQSQLVSVEIGDSVTNIGDYAFRGCSSLQSIKIPSSVTSIQSYAFQNCTSLISVTFEENSVLTSIGSYVIIGCSSLQSIEIPSSVTSIGSSVFSGSNLQSIEIPSSVTSIGSSAFRNCTNLVSVTFEENSALQSIGGYAFSGSNLQSIEIPSSVTSIGSSAFQNCTNLVSVTFEENSVLTSIGSYAFSGCSSLQSIEIPSSVTSIESYSYVFRGSTSIYRIVVESEDVVVGLTSTSRMGELLSAINDVGDRLYVLDSIDGSVPDYVKNNYTKLALTETVDGKTYYIYKKN